MILVSSKAKSVTAARGEWKGLKGRAAQKGSKVPLDQLALKVLVALPAHQVNSNVRQILRTVG